MSSSSTDQSVHTRPNRLTGRFASSKNLRRLLAVTAAVVAVILVMVLVVRARDGAQPNSSRAMDHIHGLGIDPSDESLYAGTHNGLFRIASDGTATLIANRTQDFMGFTVAGPGRFLASGHPAAGDDGPSSLGLIESTDGGRTWMSLSLSGQADFHSLRFRDGSVYGLDSATGQLMVSNDTKSWLTLSNEPLADFAVSPDSPSDLIATTQAGVARSADGGRTFTVLEGAPFAQLVSWAADGTIGLATPGGDIYVSSDDAATWSKGATLGGPPEALLVQTRAEMYAAADGAILTSVDGGSSFSRP